MSCGGVLSAVMTIAGSGLLSNTGLDVNSALTSNLGSFNNLPVTSQFSSIVTSATGTLSAGPLEQLRTLASDNFPSITNAIPADFTSALGSVSNGGFTGLINSTAQTYMGSGDLSKFSQVLSSAQGFVGQSNTFLGSALNADSLSSTFSSVTGGMTTLTTGSFNQVTTALGSFGGDLSKIGTTLNLSSLPTLGSPSTLLKQLGDATGGELPGVTQVLSSAGISSSTISNVITGNGALTPNLEKLAYDGMKQITGSDLTQVKSLLGVTNLPNVTNMAQLLDPKQILPDSFKTLTMPTADGLLKIYNSDGSVNTNLAKYVKLS